MWVGFFNFDGTARMFQTVGRPDDKSPADRNIFKDWRKELFSIAKKGISSLPIKYSDISTFSEALSQMLLDYPSMVLDIGEEIATSIYKEEGGELERIFIRIMEPSDLYLISIHDLDRSHFGKLVSIDGTVKTKTQAQIRSKVLVFKCSRCGVYLREPQENLFMSEPLECRKDEGGCGKGGNQTTFKQIDVSTMRGEDAFNFATVGHDMINYQVLTVEEPLEGIDVRDSPLKLTLVLENDLVQMVHGNDSLRFTGILKQKFVKNGNSKSTLGILYLEVNSIEGIEGEELTSEDIEQIIALSRQENILQMLVDSFAAGICGYEDVKFACLQSVFGGVTRDLDGTHQRGEIHFLMVGDPSTGKSVLMRFAVTISPRGRVAQSGRASGAGILGCGIRDELTGTWTAEAGLMALSHGGVLGVDEFGDLDPVAKKALKPAMEQGLIELTVGGARVTHLAYTALIATANPKFGRFDTGIPILPQVKMDPALYSRLDQMAFCKDEVDNTNDRKIFDQIRMNRSGKCHDKENAAPISLELLKKYVQHAKTIDPKLNKTAWNYCENFYATTRGKFRQGCEDGYFLTVRNAEGLIRLTESIARMRLSKEATVEDAKKAISQYTKLMEFAVKDIKTGEIDMEAITLGKDKSERGLMRRFREILEEIVDTERKNILSRDTVKIAASRRGISNDDTDKAIQKFIRSGNIVEIAAGTKLEWVGT
jgi:replicative DNA helicase Mcm